MSFFKRAVIVALVLVIALLPAAGCKSKPKTQAPAGSAPAPAASPAAEKTGKPVPTIDFVIPSPGAEPDQNETCKEIAASLEKLGMTVNLVPTPDWASFVNEMSKPESWDLGSAGYTPKEKRLDPDSLLMQTFHSTQSIKAGNFSGYQNPEFDKAVEAQRTDLNNDSRKEKVFKCQEILARDIPFLTQFFKHSVEVYRKDKWENPVYIPGLGIYNFWTFMEMTPKKGQNTLVLSRAGDLPVPNPMAVVTQTLLVDMKLIWDTLYRVDRTGVPIPWMVSKVETPNPTTIRLTLKDNLKFHDGTPVTSADVKFSFDYINKWQAAIYLPSLKGIKEVKAVDPKVVEFVTEDAFATIYISAFNDIPILPKAQWENAVEKNNLKNPDEWKTPCYIGSGPFKVAKIIPAEAWILEKDPNYFVQPKVDRIQINRFAGVDQVFMPLMNGDADLSDAFFGSTQIDQAKGYPNIEILKYPGIEVRFMQFNLRDSSPFKDYWLRLAVSHAVDYDMIVKDILKGDALPGSGIISPANKFWANDKIPLKETANQIHYHQYDLQKAKAILEKAGYFWDKNGKLMIPDGYKPQPFPKDASEY